jgi:flagellar biosynthetic protein FliR
MMLTLAALAATHAETFVLAFCRLGAMMAWAPVLGHRSIPVAHRAALAALLALVLAPMLGRPPAAARDDLGFVLAMAGEAFVGLAIGFVATLVLTAVHVAGEVVGFQMGFGIAAVYDPALGQQATVVTRFHEFFALLLFLALNGHHLLLQAVVASFHRVGPGGLLVQSTASGGVVALGGKLFRSGLELAAPLIGILFIVNVAFALLARLAPQMNVFFVGVPVTLGLGIYGLAETFPHFTAVFGRLVSELAGDLSALVAGAAHGLR